MFSGGRFDKPLLYETPIHMVCRICGLCSTAIDCNRVCWRHAEHINDSYIGQKIEINGKELP